MWALLYYILDASPKNAPKTQTISSYPTCLNQENGTVLSKWELQMKTIRVEY